MLALQGKHVEAKYGCIVEAIITMRIATAHALLGGQRRELSLRFRVSLSQRGEPSSEREHDSAVRTRRLRLVLSPLCSVHSVARQGRREASIACCIRCRGVSVIDHEQKLVILPAMKFGRIRVLKLPESILELSIHVA